MPTTAPTPTMLFLTASRPEGSNSMIKDIIVHLEHQAARDPARDFAVTIAEIFDAQTAPVLLSALARRFDLSVLMQSEPNRVDNDEMIEASLFESGRSLIVVPYIQKDGLKLDHVVCCWDGSRAATRAINDGLPLLVKATTVDLLIVLNEKTDTSPNQIRGAEMAKHLARHDVKVQIVTVPTADIDVTNAILSYVADVSGTLIVMGGYGHAKLREMILGGVTRGMLQSMTVPVFMSH